MSFALCPRTPKRSKEGDERREEGRHTAHNYMGEEEDAAGSSEGEAEMVVGDNRQKKPQQQVTLDIPDFDDTLIPEALGILAGRWGKRERGGAPSDRPLATRRAAHNTHSLPRRRLLSR